MYVTTLEISRMETCIGPIMRPKPTPKIDNKPQENGNIRNKIIGVSVSKYKISAPEKPINIDWIKYCTNNE